LLFCICIQPGKELFVAAVVDFSQLDNDTGPDVQLAGFVFCIGGSADITAPALQLRTKLLLGQSGFASQSAQIVAHISVPSDFLLHNITPANFLTNIGCKW
jgi:hypothetical protein